MSSPTPARSVTLGEIDTWNETADVVVVGFGVAGASAAYEAAATGASVLLLERSGAAGGAAALSDGMVYLGGGTSTQKAAGVQDDPVAMRTFLLAACGPEPDEAKIEVYVDRSTEHHDWLVSRGVRFLGAVNPESTGPSAADGEGLMFTGGESLVVDEDGVVVGVVARRYGERVTVRARRGVVLTAGGFVMNDSMLRRHVPAALRTTHRVGTEGDDGRGIRMAQSVGARVKRMDSLECALPFNLSPSNVRGILVDQLGRRFINEDTYLGRVGQAALERDAVYLVVDEARLDPRRWPLTPPLAVFDLRK